MKKGLLILALVVVGLGLVGVGAAFAQAIPENPINAVGMMGGRWGSQDGYGPGTMMGGRGGYGPAHDYVEQALAEKLDLTEAQVEEQLAAGSTMAQIALDNGIAEADLAAFFSEVHTAAFDKAVADGVMTREQADWMLQNMQAGWENGMPCLDGGARPQDGTGYRGGQGMMGGGRGGRWQNQQTTP